MVVTECGTAHAKKGDFDTVQTASAAVNGRHFLHIPAVLRYILGVPLWGTQDGVSELKFVKFGSRQWSGESRGEETRKGVLLDEGSPSPWPGPVHWAISSGSLACR